MNIYPEHAGVGGLCIKCDFCTYMNESETTAMGHMEDGKFIVDEVIDPGTYICTNFESPQGGRCVVASQLRNFPDVAKEIALEGVGKIAAVI